MLPDWSRFFQAHGFQISQEQLNIYGSSKYRLASTGSDQCAPHLSLEKEEAGRNWRLQWRGRRRQHERQCHRSSHNKMSAEHRPSQMPSTGEKMLSICRKGQICFCLEEPWYWQWTYSPAFLVCFWCTISGRNSGVAQHKSHRNRWPGLPKITTAAVSFILFVLLICCDVVFLLLLRFCFLLTFNRVKSFS